VKVARTLVDGVIEQAPGVRVVESARIQDA
jgi:hypothetical protein